MSDVPDYLRRDGDAIATPAFRVIAYWDVDKADIATAQNIIDLFITHYGAGLEWMRYADAKKDSRGKAVNNDTLATGLSWLAAQSHPEFMFRLNGPVDDETDEVGIPQLRLEQVDRVFQGNRMALEISVPLAGFEEFIEPLTGMLKTTPLTYGVMGFGFYMPAANESLINYLPQSMARYRTALELQFDSGLPGLKRPEEGAGRHWDSKPKLLGGIPDIGWRTFVGNEYLPRLPDIANAPFPDDVIVQSGKHMMVLTAGSAPIWGDVNRSENIAAYSAIAQALIPIAPPREIAYGNFFGDLTGDFEACERLDAYFSRLLE